MGLLGHPRNIIQSQHSRRRRRVCFGVQLDDVRDRGRVPGCDSLGVRRAARKAGEAMSCEHDRFDKQGGAWLGAIATHEMKSTDVPTRHADCSTDTVWNGKAERLPACKWPHHKGSSLCWR